MKVGSRDGAAVVRQRCIMGVLVVTHRAISGIKREAKTRLQRKPAAGKVHIFPKVGFKVLSESLWSEK